jgi:hypothetical protein
MYWTNPEQSLKDTVCVADPGCLSLIPVLDFSIPDLEPLHRIEKEF